MATFNRHEQWLVDLFKKEWKHNSTSLLAGKIITFWAKSPLKSEDIENLHKAIESFKNQGWVTEGNTKGIIKLTDLGKKHILGL